MKTKLFWLASLTFLAALMISGTAFAEGEEPPVVPYEPAVAVEGQPAPAEAPPPTDIEPEETPAELPTVGEEPLAGSASVPEEAPAADPAKAPAAEPVEAPQVVVVDPVDIPLDMTSQASANAIASSDPYFTVGLITYRFSEVPDYCKTVPDPAHCFDPSSSFPLNGNAIQFAIDYIWNNPGTNPTNGNIYVEKYTYSGDVTIDAQANSVLATLKGLIGIAEGGVFPTIDGMVTVRGTTSGFTLSGFTIKNAVHFDGNTGALNLTDLDVSNPNGDGIKIENQKGNIVLTRVKSSNNRFYGANIDNLTAGNVTITNSAFDKNGDPADGKGLVIISNGIVSINGLSASGNYHTGLDVKSFSSLTLKNAVLNSNTSAGTAWGLYADTPKIAAVVLENVIANDNRANGIKILTAGAISLKTVDTHRNADSGIYLDNGTGTGPVALTGIKSGNNDFYGIYVRARGAITLTSVKAYQNHGIYGAYLDNCLDVGGVCTGTGSVTVTSPAAAGAAGANSFWGNDAGYGLYIDSNGAVTVANTDAYANDFDGLYILNGAGTVTINKNLANWTNDFSDNGGRGIFLDTQGIVTISSSVASSNQGTGIEVNGKGSITLTNVEAYTNGLAGGGSEYNGLKLTNTAGSGGVTIKSSVPTTYMDFSGNHYYGIAIYSKGAVSVSNVSVNETIGMYGLLIENYITSGAPPVSITNSNFNLNNGSGVVVNSRGAITLTNVSATNSKTSSSYGVYLNNTHGSASGVTIRSSSPTVYYEYSKNSASGIYILSKGAVSVSNVLAQGNGQNGMTIQNDGATSDLPVSVSGSLANDNGYYGIEIVSKGTVTLTNTGASDNTTGYGVMISNWEGTAYTGATIRSTLTSGFIISTATAWAGFIFFPKARSRWATSLPMKMAITAWIFGDLMAQAPFRSRAALLTTMLMAVCGSAPRPASSP